MKGKNPSNPQVYSLEDRQHDTITLKTLAQVKREVELYLTTNYSNLISQSEF